MFHTFEIALPDWTDEFLKRWPDVIPDPDERMRLAIQLAGWNVDRGTGGPFGAAVFEQESGRLVAIGVNRVVPSHCSAAHAEVVALSIAQKMVQNYDLGAPGLPMHELVTSAQPCAMCFGATIWSGVRRLVYGATADDVVHLTGFDEGPLPADWEMQLAARGITVVGGLLRDEARAVLARYKEQHGIIYNSRRGGPASG